MKITVIFLAFFSLSVFGQDCEFNAINIEVLGSDSEIEWNISQDPGWGEFVSGALGSYEDICLEDGCYTLNMYDDNGDGWNETTITISYSQTNEIIFSGTLEDDSVESSYIQIGNPGYSCPTPCDLFDHNGDGFIGANTWLHVLGQYGVPGYEGSMDINNTGIIDVEDLISFIPFFGHSCPGDWHDTTNNHMVDLILVEWQIHENELIGFNQNIPPNSITYRLYVQFSNPEDKVLAMYGNESTPLSIVTDGEFYGFGNEPGEMILVGSYMPEFDSFVPANQYTTWLSAGQYPIYDDGQINTSYISVDWALNGVDSSTIEFNDEIGGAWFATNGGAVSSAENSIESLSLIGQFTVIGDNTSLEGTINVLAETQVENGHAIELVEGLTFSSENVTVLGCTLTDAINFNPDANFNDGSCLTLGDYDSDGFYTVTDFLDLLSEYGCSDCPQGDLNGDGVVTVIDILLFLSWI
jgi:hypothetical protein